jgi:DNA (cytosine-5)-methyltransferase 1
MDGGNREPMIIDEIKVIGNYMPSNHDASRVVDIEGIAPTVKENHGTVTAIAEPFIVASRGRNPDNPSDRTTGAPTEQRLEPNFSGCTNTLTSVQKDNYVCEPIIYDDYNSRISSDQDAINTLTCNCGASAERNGVKIIEPRIVEDQFPGSRDARIYPNYSPTLRQNCGGLEVAKGEIAEKIRWRIRKLTSLECWKLMAFFISDHNRAAKYVSASSLYKQAGNSIVVNVLIALMSSLFIEDGHKAEKWSQYTINIVNDTEDDDNGEHNI